MARRDDRAYREYVRKKQRRQWGCHARKVVLDQPGRATKSTPKRTRIDGNAVREQHDDVSGTRDQPRMARAAAEGNLEVLAAVWRKRPGEHRHQPIVDDDADSLPAQ